MRNKLGKPVSQRQLRVGEMIKQSLSIIFSRNEAKLPNLETNDYDRNGLLFLNEVFFLD